MTHSLVNPADPPDRQYQKLLQIVDVLMRRVEQSTDDGGVAYAQFQRAVMLEDQVRQRTAELEHALDLLNSSNALLAEATQKAEAAQQNLANAIETVQEGFALFDANDVLVMCNSRFGMHMTDIHPGLKPGLGFTDYISMVARSSSLALPEGETPESWAIGRIRRHSDRHAMLNVRLTRDRWLQVSEHRTRDGGTVILQTDVTDIIRLERQERGKLLDDQARMIRATLDHINQGVCIFDAERRLVGWNRRLGEILTLSMTRLQIGTSFATLLGVIGDQFALGDGFTIGALSRWVEAAAPRQPLSFEIRRDDDVVLVVHGREMPDRGFVMSFSDITAERAAVRAISEANETLEQRVSDRTTELADALGRAERANSARSRFVAAASHDLLQPLSAAKLFISSISDEALADTARQTLEKAQNALASVEGILDALLDISKLESGHAAVNVQPIEIGPVLARLEEEFAPMAERKRLDLAFAPVAGVVETDPVYLRRILQNLINNAILYTREGGVYVTAEIDGDRLTVAVRDTGPGIPESEQANIFREFHRLNARASASEGMGLGLAIVDRACALLGHPLSLTSAPGEGTRFAITLPVASRRSTAVDEPALPGRPAGDAQAGRIVCLVENDAELRRAMCQLLEKWGLEVIDVDNGEEALALLDEIDIVPDLFLVDYQLGEGMNGLELISALRDRHGRIAATVVTANRSAGIARSCESAGVAMLHKPINSDDLARIVLH